MRIDKFLWCVRIYKTRELASEAVKVNRVTVVSEGTEGAEGAKTGTGAWIKSSYDVKVGDVLDVRKGQVTYRFRVLALTANRVSAALTGGFVEDITPREELDKLNVPRETVFVSRDRGTGRPTKKERRDLDTLLTVNG